MAQTIQIKRGLKSQLETNPNLLQQGELGFCTDTKEVFIGTGAGSTFVGQALSGDYTARPLAKNQGRFYFVTQGANAGYLYFDDGTTWHRVNARALSDLTGSLADISGTLDDIADGTAFKKVRAEDVTGGHVNKVSDGAYTATAEQISKHIGTDEIHRKINDSAEGNTDLWSAQKIKTEIFNAIKGMDWQDSVKSMSVVTPPASPSVKDRYLVAQNAQGDWAGKAGQIAEWNGSSWVYSTPQTGFAAYVEDLNKNFTYNKDGQWVPTGGANQTVEAGMGLIGGGSNDSVTLDIGAGDGIVVTADAVAVKGYNGITVDSNGVGVKGFNGITVDANGVGVKGYSGITVDGNGVSANVDNFSIVFDGTSRLTVSHIDGGTFA